MIHTEVRTFWHLTHPRDFLLHNARLAKGTIATASLMVSSGLEGVITSYAANYASSDKERVWEEIRSAEFPDRGSRLNGLYVFPTRPDAEMAQVEWFANEDRVIVEVRPVRLTSCHVGDARHLDQPSEYWPEAARKYWRRDTTDDPRIEIVLHGQVFFPGWESEPFGLYNSPQTV